MRDSFIELNSGTALVLMLGGDLSFNDNSNWTVLHKGMQVNGNSTTEMRIGT